MAFEANSLLSAAVMSLLHLFTRFMTSHCNSTSRLSKRLLLICRRQSRHSTHYSVFLDMVCGKLLQFCIIIIMIALEAISSHLSAAATSQLCFRDKIWDQSLQIYIIASKAFLLIYLQQWSLLHLLPVTRSATISCNSTSWLSKRLLISAAPVTSLLRRPVTHGLRSATSAAVSHPGLESNFFSSVCSGHATTPSSFFPRHGLWQITAIPPHGFRRDFSSAQLQQSQPQPLFSVTRSATSRCNSTSLRKQVLHCICSSRHYSIFFLHATESAIWAQCCNSTSSLRKQVLFIYLQQSRHYSILFLHVTRSAATRWNLHHRFECNFFSSVCSSHVLHLRVTRSMTNSCKSRRFETTSVWRPLIDYPVSFFFHPSSSSLAIHGWLILLWNASFYFYLEELNWLRYDLRHFVVVPLDGTVDIHPFNGTTFQDEKKKKKKEKGRNEKRDFVSVLLTSCTYSYHVFSLALTWGHLMSLMRFLSGMPAYFTLLTFTLLTCPWKGTKAWGLFFITTTTTFGWWGWIDSKKKFEPLCDWLPVMYH